MLISTNKKNNIAKSIALMLALVLAFSCILTACADKTARKDVEDLKATVDTLGKDVDTVEGVANSAVTNDALTKALADALAKYLDKEGHDADIAALLKDYAKTADAEKFVTELLKGYYTQAQIDEMLKGYYTKAEVDTLIANFVAEEDIPGFIAEYLATPEAKDAIAELLEDTYMDLGDWNAATAEVMTAIANVSAALGALDYDIFTVADYEKFVELVETAFEVYIDEEGYLDDGQLMIDILRATDPSEFDYIEQLAKDTADLDAASEAIEAINAKIKALQTASEGKIDTDDKAALDEIKAAIVAFDAKYGFNATTITVDVATADFRDAFCGTVMDDVALEAKLVIDNDYESNADYVTYGGLMIVEYITMQERYDFLMAWAADIDEMIVELVAEIGEDQSISDTQLALIQDVMDEVRGDAGFVAANNTITTPIKGWNTYVYYEWLAGKRIFDDDKIASKADLDAYASANAAKFDSSEMNSDVATIVTNAKKALDALTYASYKSYTEADAARKVVVETAKKDIDEKLNYYRFDDTVLKAIATLEAAKPNDDKYASVVIIANDAIAAVKAVTPATEGAYTYTAAYNAVVAAKDNGLAAMALMEAKINAKAEVLAYAKNYLKGGATALFAGDEKNYNDVEAAIIADAEATYASIDAVDTVAKVAEAVTAAKVAVDKAAYAQALNVYMADAQADIFAIAADAKTYATANAGSNVNYTKIGDLATASVIKVRADGLKAYVLVTGSEDPANDVTTWAAAYAKAKAAVDAEKTAFTAKEEVKAYLDLVRI